MEESQTVESVGDPLGTKLLTFVLSVIAGSVDVIGFLGLGALFIAHVTGNLVILAARAAAGEQAPAAHLSRSPNIGSVGARTRVLLRPNCVQCSFG